MLTPQQVNHFHTFGFLKMPGLFRDEFHLIEASFHEVWNALGGGHAGDAHDGMRRSALVPFIDRHEYLSALIEELIDELRENFTIVIVTHSMQQAARVSQKTAFFHLGNLVEVGSTEQIFTNPGDERTQGYITGRFG